MGTQMSATLLLALGFGAFSAATLFVIHAILDAAGLSAPDHVVRALLIGLYLVLCATDLRCNCKVADPVLLRLDLVLRAARLRRH
jgi:hypothetical protein